MKKAPRKPVRHKPLRRLDRDDALRILVQQGQDASVRLARIERMLFHLVRADHDMESDLMALKATDQALITEIHRNTDVAAAVKTAFEAQTAAIADLTAKLADAIANSDAADDPDVRAALAELTANNDATIAATPVLAKAAANTDAKAPVPQV